MRLVQFSSSVLQRAVKGLVELCMEAGIQHYLLCFSLVAAPITLSDNT